MSDDSHSLTTLVCVEILRCAAYMYWVVWAVVRQKFAQFNVVKFNLNNHQEGITVLQGVLYAQLLQLAFAKKRT